MYNIYKVKTSYVIFEIYNSHSDNIGGFYINQNLFEIHFKLQADSIKCKFSLTIILI